MNDKTPDTPNSDHTLPAAGSSDAQTVPVSSLDEQQPATSAAPAATSTDQAPNATKRTAFLIGGAIVAAALLGGGGVAVGAAIADDDDDDRPVATAPHEDGARQDAAPQRGDTDDDDRDAPGDSSAPIDLGTASADDLVNVAKSARATGEGVVTSIDAEADGAWEVQLTTEAGDQTEIIVDTAGKAIVQSTERGDADDVAPSSSLDDAAIRAIVKAALGAQEGTVVELGADNSPTAPYEVSVLTSSHTIVDIRLDAKHTVVSTEIED